MAPCGGRGILAVSSTFVLALCVLWVTLPQVGAAPPTFDATPYVATLDQDADQTVTIMQLPCSDADGDSTVVSMVSGGVTPNFPCGSCFRVLPCVTGGTVYCLIYYVGSLNVYITPEYNIEVECEDSTGAVVTENVDLRITLNSPPTFVPDQRVASKIVADTKNVKAGERIYGVDATDIDGDSIVFTMTTEPVSDFFEIGSGNGIIRAKRDLKSECIDFITFLVTIDDGHNPPVGPLRIHTTLEGSNQQPDMTNLDITIPVPEDTGKSAIYTIQPTDDDSLGKLTYTLTVDPATNYDYFGLNGNDIRVTETLDYETSYLQTTDLTIVASDGFCTSEPRNVRLTLTDVNEPPTLTPENKEYSVYEGPDFGPAFEIDWRVIDEDFIDTHTFEIVGGNSGDQFSIDPDTGQLSVTGDYDIDIPNSQATSTTLRIQVTDKGGLTDRTNVVLNFLDRNDRYPAITEGDFSFNVCEGKRIGATLGTLNCTDDDLTSPNNDVYFTGGGNGITILPGGSIILATAPALGQTIFTEARCTDRGIYPGPLTSVTPVPVTVTITECPTVTPVPVTTAAPVTTATAAPATTASPSTGDNGADWIEENLWWIILAALLLTALLALLAYMLWRYCWPWCGRLCRTLPCRRRAPVKRRMMDRPPKIITPVESPSPSPLPQPKPRELEMVTPRAGTVVGNAALLPNFWQEDYLDNDYKAQPNRQANPKPVTPQAGAQRKGSGDPIGNASRRPIGNGSGHPIGNGSGHPIGNGNVPEKRGGLSVPPKKKKFCNIL